MCRSIRLRFMIQGSRTKRAAEPRPTCGISVLFCIQNVQAEGRFALCSTAFRGTRWPGSWGGLVRLCQHCCDRRTRFSAAGARRKGQTMKLYGGLLLVMLSSVSLAGCLQFRGAGPCYGAGCAGFTQPPASAPQNSSSQPAAARGTETAANQPDSPAAKRSHGLHALLKKAKL